MYILVIFFPIFFSYNTIITSPLLYLLMIIVHSHGSVKHCQHNSTSMQSVFLISVNTLSFITDTKLYLPNDYYIFHYISTVMKIQYSNVFVLYIYVYM